MNPDPKLVAELTTFTPQDIALMEEQAAEALYLAKKTRFKYRRELHLALADRRLVLDKPRVPVAKQPQPVRPEPMAVVLCGGFVVAGGYLAVFFGVLWVISQAFR